MKSKPLLVVLSGPSGAGKDAAMNAILEQKPDMERFVTYTSRGPREGEIEGVDYHFISRSKFEEMINNDQLFEWVKYGNDYKGTPKHVFKNVLAGTSQLLRIDMTRAARLEDDVREKFPKEVAEEINSSMIKILIGVPSLMSAYQRAKARDPHLDKHDFIKRYQIDWQVWKNSQDRFPNVIINNTDELDSTVEQALTLIEAYGKN